MLGSDIENLVVGFVEEVEDTLQGYCSVFLFPTGDMVSHTVTCRGVESVGRFDDKLVAAFFQHLYPLFFFPDSEHRQRIDGTLDDFEIHERVDEAQFLDFLIESE